jgi:hypothetical protein
MGGVSTPDDSHYSLVSAAAQAAGPCAPGEEEAWGRRVRQMAVELHLIAADVRQDTEDLKDATRFIAVLEKVEIEASSRRGLLTLRNTEGETETIRTDQEHTYRGQALIRRAQSLEGRWVLVWKYMETMAGQKKRSVRMLAHLMELSDSGTLPSAAAKTIVLREAGDDVERARQAWTAAGLPDDGPVSIAQLDQARAAAKKAASPAAR